MVATGIANCDVYFTHTDQSGVNQGKLAKIVVQDLIENRVFIADNQTPSTNSVHGLVLFPKNAPADFSGKQSYVTRASSWNTVILIGSSLENAIVVQVGNYNAENRELDQGTGLWGGAGEASA